MSRTIQTVYIVHHSHTDIGYTDLQEKIRVDCTLGKAKYIELYGIFVPSLVT